MRCYSVVLQPGVYSGEVVRVHESAAFCLERAREVHGDAVETVLAAFDVVQEYCQRVIIAIGALLEDDLASFEGVEMILACHI